MVGFIFSILLAFFLIPIFKRLKANQQISEYLTNEHNSKVGTPTMGGFIFIIPTVLIFLLLYYFGKIELSYNLFIVLFTFVGYSLIGFIDDYLIVVRKNNKGLSEASKIIMQLVVAVIFFYFFMKAGNEPLLWIQTLGIKIEMGWLYGLFILFVLVASSNAVNITDGLDGLAGGLSVIALLSFGIISYGVGWLDGYEEIALFCFTLMGSLLGFLVFNSHPARIFMGDTGSLSLGAALGAIAIITRHELLLIVIGIAFVIETLSSLLQRYYYKLTKKRLFPMTPIHHTFEKMGWNEVDIVKLFWVIGLIGGISGIIFGVWI